MRGVMEGNQEYSPFERLRLQELISNPLPSHGSPQPLDSMQDQPSAEGCDQNVRAGWERGIRNSQLRGSGQLNFDQVRSGLKKRRPFRRRKTSEQVRLTLKISRPLRFLEISGTQEISGKSPAHAGDFWTIVKGEAERTALNKGTDTGWLARV